MPPDPLPPGDHTCALRHRGYARSYLMHIPPQYDGSAPSPVVLAFHGGATNGEQMVQFCGLSDKADEAGFIVVYPNGTGENDVSLTWNAGNCCGYALRNEIDDVGYVRLLLNDLAGVVNVDANRVFATGMSNGGMMAYRLASELSERIAAIAPVGGPMGTEECDPQRPVPILHFHGTNDEFAPFEGGQGRKSVSGTDFYSVEHTLQAWIKANGCPAEPQVTKLPDKVADGTSIERAVYGPGREGSEVVLITIHGGGHTWPGRQPRLWFLGKSTEQISANDLMWEFFQKHPLPPS